MFESTLNNSLRHVFPEGSSHQRLADASLLQQVLDLLQGKQVYGQVLRIFQVLLGDFLHVRSQETVGNVGVGTWIGRDLHELFPYSVSIAGFFQKFPLCGKNFLKKFPKMFGVFSKRSIAPRKGGSTTNFQRERG